MTDNLQYLNDPGFHLDMLSVLVGFAFGAIITIIAIVTAKD